MGERRDWNGGGGLSGVSRVAGVAPGGVARVQGRRCSPFA